MDLSPFALQRVLNVAGADYHPLSTSTQVARSNRARAAKSLMSAEFSENRTTKSAHTYSCVVVSAKRPEAYSDQISKPLVTW
jgi:hypothetical protein